MVRSIRSLTDRTVRYSTELIHFDAYDFVKLDVGWKNLTVILSFFMFLILLCVQLKMIS